MGGGGGGTGGAGETGADLGPTGDAWLLEEAVVGPGLLMVVPPPEGDNIKRRRLPTPS